MSREIKFRAWNGEKYHYQEDQYLTSFLRRFIRDINYDKDVMSNHESYLDNNLDSYLQQYTGIKDKNDKEIYEGDIVSFMYLKDKVERKKGMVVFDLEELCYFIRTNSEWGYNHNLAWCETEVIGNIYENKGLLENA